CCRDQVKFIIDELDLDSLLFLFLRKTSLFPFLREEKINWCAVWFFHLRDCTQRVPRVEGKTSYSAGCCVQLKDCIQLSPCVEGKNQLGVAGPSVQRNVVEGTSDGKDSASVKPRSQTLDALFANLKQRRMMNKQIPSGDKSANPRSRRHRQLRQERERLGAPLKRPVAGARCLAPSGCWHRLAPGSRLPASGGRHPAPGIQPRLAADTSGVRRRSTAGVIRRLAPSGRRLAPSGYQRSASGAQRRPAIGAVQKLTLGGQ
ncbi:hypothetical protein Taro_039521, partial [Colocasia esculenta]|nr:hypothetical protein [Colocasia esculenta]